MHQARRLLEDYEEAGLGWFWSTDTDGRINYISDCIAKQIGVERSELLGEQFHAVVVLDTGANGMAERTLPLIMNSRKKISAATVRPAVGGMEVWWSISGRPHFSETGEFLGYCGNGCDVSEEQTAIRDASQLASYDSLTGLANRHRITQRLDATLKAYSASKRCCAIMMLDLDRFKQVNDTLGHPAGDALLKQVAERLHQAIDSRCEIGRLGGDEFQLIVPDVDDRGELGERARKIIEMLSQPYSLEEGRCVIGASIGIAIAPYDGIDSEALVRGADLALYAAKGGGRGQFRFYSADLLAEAQRRRQLKSELGDALDRDQMQLAYQPRVDGANKVVALQAFVVWNHPDFEEIPHDTFWPMAIESNLVVPLIEWSLRQACADAAEWPGGVKVAVTVPMEQFAGKDLPAVVTQALADSGLEPERLEIEVEESIFTGDYEPISKHLNTLRMLGVRLVLDDFGTGYASLGHLRKSPFDKIKISECFVRQVEGESDGNEAIVTAIQSLARAMKMATVAVGADAMLELEILRKHGVDEVQGGIFAPPLPFADVVEAMADGTWLLEPDGPRRVRNERRSVLRNVGLIHEDYRYEVRMRNLSRTGCLVEGLMDVPVETQFVVDFGSGQLAVARVLRSVGAQQGLEFELPLVDDGVGGLVTRNRVSPYALAAAGMPLNALPPGNYPLSQLPGAELAFHQPKFAQLSTDRPLV